MKDSSKLLLILLFISLVLTAIFLAGRQKSPQTNNSSADEIEPIISTEPFEPTKPPPQIIEITANEGNFDPNFLQLTQYEDAILKVNAVDQDYSFILSEFEVDAIAPQGRVTEIQLPAKAVGSFIFSCGPECSGEVEVKDNDPDSDF